MYSLEVRNVGLVPAVITAARVYYRDELAEGEGPPVIKKAFTYVPNCQLVAHPKAEDLFIEDHCPLLADCSQPRRAALGQKQSFHDRYHAGAWEPSYSVH